MYTFIFLFSLPLIALIIYVLTVIVREVAKGGMKRGFLKRALYGSETDEVFSKRDKRGCLMVLIGGFFFFVGYWIALFSLFSSAFLLFFIGVGIMVIGMVVSLRPVLSR